MGFVIHYLRSKLGFNKYILWSIIFLLKNNQHYHILIPIYIVMFGFLKCKLFDKSKRPESNYIVLSNQNIIPNHYLIKIKSPNNIDFKPGQYINLYFNKEKRAYTPIEVSNNEFLFFIKQYPNGLISPNIVESYKPDSTVFIKGSFGSKYYDPYSDLLYIDDQPIDKTNIIMFSCGTGITPFYSIILNLQTNTKYNILLNCSFRLISDTFLLDKLYQSNLTNFNQIKTNLYLSELNNKLDHQQLILILNNYDKSNTIVLVCGTHEYNQMILNIADQMSFEAYSF